MKSGKPPHSDVTPEPLYRSRREFIRDALLFTGVAGGLGAGLLRLTGGVRQDGSQRLLAGASDSLQVVRREELAGGEALNTFEQITTYNNFYEFGLDKADPSLHAHTLRTRPWTVAIEGLVREPRTLDLDTLLGWFPLEERIYRLRCVEAWSMVIPWVGFPLADLVRRLDPAPSARFVAFTTLLDPEQDRKSTRLNSSHSELSRMPSSA